MKGYGAYYNEGFVSLVLEYMDLGSLRKLVQSANLKKLKIPEKVLATIVAQVFKNYI